MTRIGFVGTGHIAAPMARFLAGRGHPVIVTERSRDVSEALAAEIGAQVTDAAGVVAAADIVFLCLRPGVAEDILRPLAFREEQAVVSVMAGLPRERLLDICAPATRLVRCIPLGFLERGGCPLAAHGDTGLLDDLFAPENPVVALGTEAALEAHFPVSAVIPGYLDMILAAGDWLGTRTGDGAAGRYYVAQMLAGFLAAQDLRDGEVLARERDLQANPGTLSLIALEAVRAGGGDRAVRQALDAVETRTGGG